MANTARPQRAQILVIAAAIMAFLFVPLAVYVIDSGLVEASHIQLGETLEAAAEDGAQSLDVGAYRESGGRVVRLDREAARATTDRSLRISDVPGLDAWAIDADDRSVTVSGRMRVPLLVLGEVTILATRRATFVVGA